MAEIGVSIAEIIEVRNCGFNIDELLALILISCEQLGKTPAGVFTPDHVIIYNDGKLKIEAVSSDHIDKQYIPPEILEGNTNVDAAAAHVYCLGEVVKFAGGADVENADVFSLVNIMTVEHIATRPSLTRLAQMAKNRLVIQNPKALLAEMYTLVMGEEDEEIDDFDVSSGTYVLEEMESSMKLEKPTFGEHRADYKMFSAKSIFSDLKQQLHIDNQSGDHYLYELEAEACTSNASKTSPVSIENGVISSMLDEKLVENVNAKNLRNEVNDMTSDCELVDVAVNGAGKYIDERRRKINEDKSGDSSSSFVSNQLLVSSITDSSSDKRLDLSDSSSRLSKLSSDVCKDFFGSICFDKLDSVKDVAEATTNGRRREHDANFKPMEEAKHGDVKKPNKSFVGAETLTNYMHADATHSDVEKAFLEGGVQNFDPFENETANLSTLSGRDPFNNYVDSNDENSTCNSYIDIDFSNRNQTGFPYANNQFVTRNARNEHQNEKQRKTLLNTEEMLGGSFGDAERANDCCNSSEIEKRGKTIDYSFDDDIVAYEDGEPFGFINYQNESQFAFEVPTNKISSTVSTSRVAGSSASSFTLNPIREDNEIEKKESNSYLPKVIPRSSSVESASKSKSSNNSGYIDDEVKDANDRSLFSNGVSSSDKRSSEIGTTEHRDSSSIIQSDNESESLSSTQAEEAVCNGLVKSNESTTFLPTRRNSLLPNRISGRKPSLRTVKGPKNRAQPEFIANENAHCICLKAPALFKKKLALHRVEQAGLSVELLNGKRIEVSCRSDAVAFEIADVVMRHMNYNENSFFGLTVFRDGEHFFLDDNQKVEKYAPAGWKAARRIGATRSPYILYLRFRYYPASVDFIKTDIVVHELYLQLRRDFLDDLIQPPREQVFEMAAIALQAEFGDRPNSHVACYFSLEHYLPKRCIDLENVKRMNSVLTELHSHHEGSSCQHAEMQFILACQRLPDYGAHMHRVFKSKPSFSLGNTPFGDPQTGIGQYIAILTRGIIEYEQQGSTRRPINEYLWQNTETLQFDKKRFVIVSESSSKMRSVLFTDHYTKSAYFVRFAASQHRFMIRMRQWNQSLRSGDSKYSLHSLPMREVKPGASSSRLTATEDTVTFTDAPTVTKTDSIKKNISVSRRHDETSCTKFDDSQRSSSPEASNEVVESISKQETGDSGEGFKFDLGLRRDSKMGLGLTLVDGNLNGIKGVYVKSVIEGGVGMNAGILVGDRLISVNECILDGKDRHAAVELVKASGDRVRLCIFRWDAVSAVAACSKWKTKKDEEKQQNTSLLKVCDENVKVSSMTPPVPRRRADALKKRQRAVSDFGAVGDALPELNSEEVIANMSSKSRNGDGSHWDMENSNRITPKFYRSVDRLDHHGAFEEMYMNSYEPPQFTGTRNLNEKSRENVHRSSEISAIDYQRGNFCGNRWNTLGESDEYGDEFLRVIFAHLDRNESGNLGVQIASSGGSVYIKQLTANPALSHPNICIGDKLVMVNGRKTQNLTHQEVVDLLRSGGNAVVLGLVHSENHTDGNDHEVKEEIVRVVLDKSPTGSLGLSLAKKTGLEGIFIRTISVGSAAHVDGTLQIGDKLWKINGQCVNSLSPSAVVEMLKTLPNPIEIIVKRTIN